MEKILFIGLGNMGLPMALNLLKAGFKLEGFDVVDKSRKEFEKAGGVFLSSLKDLDSKIIISMLPGSKENENSLLRK